MPRKPGFISLTMMRKEALAGAHAATDPLVAQQFRDLATCYDAAMVELRDNGIAVIPTHEAATIPWRSVQLRSGNDG